MAHWVYILLLEDDRIYIGETTRLLRRLYEHADCDRHGSISTDRFPVIEVLGIYKMDNNLMYYSDMGYLDIENNIVENTMKVQGDKWWKVRGGKHTTLIFDHHERSCICKDCHYEDIIRPDKVRYGIKPEYEDCNLTDFSNPSSNLKYIRPVCDCGIPADIRQSKYGNWYWKCPMGMNSFVCEEILQNNTHLCNEFDVDINSGCNFYISDSTYKISRS